MLKQEFNGDRKSLDGISSISIKASLGRNDGLDLIQQTERSQLGTKHHYVLITDGQGVPLFVVVVITAASTHDDMKGSYKHAGS